MALQCVHLQFCKLVTHTDSRTLYIQADHCPAQVSLQLHVHSADIFNSHGQIMSRTEDAACASGLDQTCNCIVSHQHHQMEKNLNSTNVCNGGLNGPTQLVLCKKSYCKALVHNYFKRLAPIAISKDCCISSSQLPRAVSTDEVKETSRAASGAR